MNNQKAKQLAFILCMAGAGLLMIGYAVGGKGYAIGTTMLIVGAVLFASTLGFLLVKKKEPKFCPKCGLRASDLYIRQNKKRFGKYTCPKCSSHLEPKPQTTKK